MDDINETVKSLDQQLRTIAAAEPLSALSAISALRTVVAGREQDAVREALTQYSWSEIGRALGVSKQAAFQRFGKQWVIELHATMNKSQMKATVRQRLKG